MHTPESDQQSKNMIKLQFPCAANLPIMFNQRISIRNNIDIKQIPFPVARRMATEIEN